MRTSERFTLLTILVVVAVIFAVDRLSREKPEVARLEKSVDTAKAQRAAAIKTVTVYVPIAAKSKARSDSADVLVDIVDDTLVGIRVTPMAAPTLVGVPLQVTKDLITLRRTVDDQARAIASLERALAADSVVIRRQDSLIAALRPSRCGAKCGGAVAAGGLLIIRALTR